MVPPCSDRISRVPPYSRMISRFTCTGLSPAKARLSRRFQFAQNHHWPGPRSLATTNGVSVDVLSSGYLDVSVPRVCLLTLCIQVKIPLINSWKSTVSPKRNERQPRVEGGFPHSEIFGSKPARGSPKLIATCYVLHRLYAPRHPPEALKTLDLSNVHVR